MQFILTYASTSLGSFSANSSKITLPDITRHSISKNTRIDSAIAAFDFEYTIAEHT